VENDNITGTRPLTQVASEGVLNILAGGLAVGQRQDISRLEAKPVNQKLPLQLHIREAAIEGVAAAVLVDAHEQGQLASPRLCQGSVIAICQQGQTLLSYSQGC
jgi:hypothetical protein